MHCVLCGLLTKGFMARHYKRADFTLHMQHCILQNWPDRVTLVTA